MIELTDFNKSLRELVIDLHFQNKDACTSQKISDAEKLVTSLVEKELITLNKNQYIQKVDDKLVLSSSQPLSLNEVIEFMSHPVNWMTENVLGNERLYYELEPTNLGEKVLDELFSKIQQKNN